MELSEKSQRESQTLAERAQGENLNISQQNTDIARKRTEQDAKAQEAQATAGYMMAGGAVMGGVGQLGTAGYLGTGGAAVGAGATVVGGAAAAGYVGGYSSGAIVSHNKELQSITPWGGKETERKGAGIVGGAAAGALVGTMIMPGIGTIVGAIVGGIAGYIASDK